nr:hypothetical protein B0A51_18948 [Rachicladosporium sp. CCFEE 5018]
MLKDTVASLIFIRITILLLQSIGPSCLAWTLLNAWRFYTGSHDRVPILWRVHHAYIAAEAAVYVFFIWYWRYLQREAVHPPLRSRTDREALFHKVCGELDNIESFLSGWFRGAKIEEIGREELRRFLDWAFWEGRATDGDAQELDGYVYQVEAMLDHPLADGSGPAKSLRLTIDPINMQPRCLLWYGLMILIDTIAALRLRSHGFVHYRTGLDGPWVLPPRPATLYASHVSPVKDLSYWCRPHTSKTRPPVVFLHGIGIGLLPHVNFLRELDRQFPVESSDKYSDGQVGLLALEILPISSRLTSPILGRAQFLSQLTTVINAHGYDKFVLVAHSYGSVLGTHMLYDEALSSRITSTLLIDPVTINLHLPDVAYNFTVRQPSKASEWQLWWFASQDPSISHVLGRHFFWYENCLWRDRLEELVRRGLRVTVSLARKDLIVNTTGVARCLLAEEMIDRSRILGAETQQSPSTQTCASWKDRPWRGQGLDILWWDDLDHAQVFDEPETVARLAEVVIAYCQSI